MFLTHNYPRHAGDVSGAFLATLAAALLRRGVEVRVIAPSDGGEIGAGELNGISVRRVRYAPASRETLAYRGTMAEAGRTPAGLWRALQLARALRGAAREEVARGAHLVHAHWWVPAGLAAPPEMPLVLTVHGTDAVLLARGWAYRTVARPVFRRARMVTTVSEHAAGTILRATGRLIPPDRVQPMPVETANYTQWSEGGGGAIVVARLTRQKRVDLALRAIAVLPPQTRLPLTIIGDGPERVALEALAAGLGVTGRVRFLGAKPPASVAAALSTADLAIFPARNEGFGLAAAEALMAGVPVVACTDGGGVLSVVPRSGAGRHADPSPEALAEAALTVLADPLSRAAAREAGKGWRLRLSPDHVAEICEGWYREALGE